MKNLFYSEKENLVFWISGYDISSVTNNEIIQYLKEKGIEAGKLFNCNSEIIKTEVINKSRRYKFMRVFYATINKCPQNAFEISDKNGWTMDKWLSD